MIFTLRALGEAFLSSYYRCTTQLSSIPPLSARRYFTCLSALDYNGVSIHSALVLILVIVVVLLIVIASVATIVIILLLLNIVVLVVFVVVCLLHLVVADLILLPTFALNLLLSPFLLLSCFILSHFCLIGFSCNSDVRQTASYRMCISANHPYALTLPLAILRFSY